MIQGEERCAEGPTRPSTEGATPTNRFDAGATVVGYGAFLLLSSEVVAESIADQRNVEIVHVVVTNADDVCSVYGDVSDQIEVTLGTILRTLTRATDLIGRISDSRYSILMEGVPRGAGLLLADRIVKAAESYNAIRGLAWPIDVSCEVLDGVAVQQLSDVFDISV